MEIKKIIKNIFRVYKEDLRIVVVLFGIRMRFTNPFSNPLGNCCCIPNIDYYLEQGTWFPHPLGIVINKEVKVGKNCKIYQHVTIGSSGRFSEERQRYSPRLGNNVIVYANAVLIGPINIGDNSIIGAGAIVTKDVPANCVVAGNPAKIIKQI